MPFRFPMNTDNVGDLSQTLGDMSAIQRDEEAETEAAEAQAEANAQHLVPSPTNNLSNHEFSFMMNAPSGVEEDIDGEDNGEDDSEDDDEEVDDKEFVGAPVQRFDFLPASLDGADPDLANDWKRTSET